jgi:uncharacterized membrane protein
VRSEPASVEGEGSANRSLLAPGALLGVGIVGSLDEIVLHQLLQWHTFYVHTTEQWRIAIDGLFHLATATLLSLGALRLWQTRNLIGGAGDWRALAGGVLLGMGGFNLFDGLVNHKLLEIHPVREGVENILLYDLAYNLIALALLAAGWLVWREARGQPPERRRAPDRPRGRRLERG